VKAVKLPCPTCRKATLKASSEVVWYRGVRLGRFLIETCSVCGAQVVDEENGRAIDRAFDRARSTGAIARLKKAAGPTPLGRKRVTAGPRRALRGVSRRARQD